MLIQSVVVRALGGLCTLVVQVQMVLSRCHRRHAILVSCYEVVSVLLAYYTPVIVSGSLVFCLTASICHWRIGIVRLEADKSIQIPKYDEKPPPPPVECCPASAAKAPPGKSTSILRTILETILRTLSILLVHLM